jgi:iron complex transport system substrate-binding protein
MPRLVSTRCLNSHRVAAAALFLCVASWCLPLRAQIPAPSPTQVPIYKDFTDELGRTVHITQPVQRIISLAPSLTETIYALGLQDHLVGDTNYCDYPPDAQRKPRVGGLMNPNLEQIVALRPDVVLMTRGPNRIETVHALTDLGIPVYGTDPHTVKEIFSSTEKLGEMLGAADTAASLKADLERRLADLQQRLSAFAPRRVLFIVWSEPLISVGQNTFIADALRHAGAVSIVESPQDWPQMSLEEVVRLQPDFLVFAATHANVAENDFDVLAERPGWRGLDAVRNRRFAVISEAVNRPAPRIVSAIEELARQLHPEAFAVHTEQGVDKKNPPQASSRDTHHESESLDNDTVQPEACACAH